jgi:Na+-driven multidrug efflux pump
MMINVYSVVIMFQAFNTVNIVGVLRGGGDTRFAMIIDLSALWCVALPLGSLAGLVFNWPLPVVFFLLVSDEPAKFLVGVWRFRTGKWLQNVTR